VDCHVEPDTFNIGPVRKESMFDIPDQGTLDAVNDAEPGDYPRFARVRRHRDPPRVDPAEATREALADVEELASLPDGASVGITAGSRGIHDMPTVLATIVEELQSQGLEPFVFPAMGSHGGANAQGQREMLAELGVTEESMGCEIRSSMDVEVVGEDGKGRPVYAAVDALEADAVLLANRVKLHTDFHGDIESGLCKMAVIGIGKQRGANAAHIAALDSSFREVIPERTGILLDEVPIVGGVAVIENAHERTAEIHGVDADDLLEREPELLERSAELFPELPVEDLDLLVLDEVGKNISGTGMDTNVVGRMLLQNEPEFDSPEITRIYVRDLTPETHGNANGIGLADFAHRRVAEKIDTTTTYVNSITGGQPERGRLPVIAPSDYTALTLTYSTAGVTDPADLRIARIKNTLEPDDLLVSEPVAEELRGREGFEVGDPEPLALHDDEFDPVDWE